MLKQLMNARSWLIAGVFTLIAAHAASALAVDWNGVASKKVVLFYPGEASWEWVLMPTHEGAINFRKGKNCRVCHQGEEKQIGADIVAGKYPSLESGPVSGKPGSLPVDISFAHDADTLYVKLQWKDLGAKARGEGKHQEVVTMMFADEAVKEAARAGCWGACHNDLKGMPDSLDLTKYLPESRTKLTAKGGGKNYKSADELKALLDKGYYMEFWQAELDSGKPAVAEDGYILKDFHENATPVVQAEGSLKDGVWTVILSRKFKVDGEGRHNLEAGKVYPVGFAIHDNYAEHRHHYVSFEHTFAIDSGDADFVAVKK